MLSVLTRCLIADGLHYNVVMFLYLCFYSIVSRPELLGLVKWVAHKFNK